MSAAPSGGALAGALAFADRLVTAEELDGDARVERLAARSHLRRRHGYRPRRGPFLGATITGPPRRLIAVLRIPALGEHWVSVPLSTNRSGKALDRA